MDIETETRPLKRQRSSSLIFSDDVEPSDTKKQKIETEPQENLVPFSDQFSPSWLPDDAVLQTFRNLSYKEVSNCSMVCQKWKRVSMHPELRWVSIVLDDSYSITTDPTRFTPGMYAPDPSANYRAMMSVFKFDQMIQSGRKLMAVEEVNINRALTQFLNRYFTRKDKRYSGTEAHRPDQAYSQLKQPTRFKGNLYKYQLDAFSWMSHIEDHIGDDIPFNPLMTWTQAKSQSLFFQNLKDHMNPWIKLPFNDAHKYNQNRQVRGGILADEMGLGKTIEMVALILNSLIDDDDESVTCLNDNDNYIARSTLIYCPSHLVNQWADALTTHSDPPVNVIKVTTMKQFNAVVCEDLCRADAVVVSFQFLQNKNYHNWVTKFNKQNAEANCGSQVPLDLICWNRIIFDEGHETIVNNPILDFDCSIKWYCTGTPFPNRLVRLFLVNFLFGTEGGNESYEKSLLFDLLYDNFYFRNTKKSIEAEEYSVPPYKTEFVFIKLSPIERLMYDSFTPDDSSKWMCCADVLKIGYAKVHQANNCPIPSSREDLRAKMVEHYEKLIENTKGKIKERKAAIVTDRQSIETHQATLDKMTPEELQRIHPDTVRNVVFHYTYVTPKTNLEFYNQKITRCQDSIKFSKNRIGEYKTDLSNYESCLALWKTIEPETIPKKDPFPNAPPLALPKDIGWKSIGTLEELSQTQIKAQLKKRDLSVNGSKEILLQRLENEIEKEEQILAIKRSEYAQQYPSSYSDDALLRKLGSKQGLVLVHLRNLWKNDPNAKVIIFSKFDTVLEHFANLLSAENISCVHINGNVYSRNKAIKAFEGDCRVMLLNLSSKASGTNLQQASQILLVDPMKGTPLEVKGIEAQAVARAHRLGQDKELLVVRFITLDTVEEEHYKLLFEQPKATITKQPSLIRQTSKTNLNSSLGLKKSGSILKRNPSSLLVRSPSVLMTALQAHNPDLLLSTSEEQPVMILNLETNK